MSTSPQTAVLQSGPKRFEITALSFVHRNKISYKCHYLVKESDRQPPEIHLEPRNPMQ